MTEALLETIRQNDLRDGYIRLIVTRGVGNLGLNPAQCKTPSVIIIAATIALYPEEVYEKGLTVVTCATRRTNPGALNPAVKSLNYLNNVMARIEANLAGADEALDVERRRQRGRMHGRQRLCDQARSDLHAADYRRSAARHYARGRVRNRGGDSASRSSKRISRGTMFSSPTNVSHRHGGRSDSGGQSGWAADRDGKPGPITRADDCAVPRDNARDRDANLRVMRIDRPSLS